MSSPFNPRPPLGKDYKAQGIIIAVAIAIGVVLFVLLRLDEFLPF